MERKGIPISSKEHLTLSGFTETPQSREYDIVKPVIQMGDRKKRITAMVVDNQPKTIVTLGLTEVVEHLTSKGIKLAEPIVNNDKVGPVDILIGAGKYYYFISRHT